MTADPLAWQEFDPFAGEPPAGVNLAPTHREADSQGLLAVLASAGARRDGWAAQAAVAVSRAWPSTGGSTALVDLDLRKPELHQLREEANAEGISDVLLWGASLDRVIQADPEAGPALVQAGTLVADPEQVYRHPAWDSFLREMAEQGRSLVLFLPDDDPGVEDLARRADSVVILATAWESERILASTTGLPVQAVLGPGQAASRADGTARRDSAPEEAGQASTGSAPTPSATGATAKGAPRTTTKPPARSKASTKSKRGPLFWLLVVVMILAGALLAVDQLDLVELPFPL